MLKKQSLTIGLIIGLLPMTTLGFVRRFFNFQMAQEVRKAILQNITEKLESDKDLDTIHCELNSIRINFDGDCSTERWYFRPIAKCFSWTTKTPISNKHCSKTLAIIFTRCLTIHPKKTDLSKRITQQAARIFSGKKRLSLLSRIRINRIITKEKKKLQANRKHSEL